MAAKRARQAAHRADQLITRAEEMIRGTWGDYEPTDVDALNREAYACRLVFQARHFEMVHGHYPEAEKVAKRAIEVLGGD